MTVAGPAVCVVNRAHLFPAAGLVCSEGCSMLQTRGITFGKSHATLRLCCKIPDTRRIGPDWRNSSSENNATFLVGQNNNIAVCLLNIQILHFHSINKLIFEELFSWGFTYAVIDVRLCVGFCFHVSSDTMPHV